jgi:hypothetical protein
MGRSARPGSGRIEELGSRRKGNRLMHKVVEIGLPNQPLGRIRLNGEDAGRSCFHAFVGFTRNAFRRDMAI